MLVCQTASSLNLLSLLFATTGTPETLSLRLYQNAVVPGLSDITSTYNICTFTGYASVTLARASWNAPATVAGVPTVTYPACTFSCTSGASQSVVGYYVVGSTSGNLYWSEIFDSPRTISSGESIVVAPQFTLASELA